MVTTRITEYRIRDRPETAEVWIQIGGHVLDATKPLPNGSPSPVAGVWVELQNPAGERLQLTQTNEAGRFTFGDLRAGRYRAPHASPGVRSPCAAMLTCLRPVGSMTCSSPRPGSPGPIGCGAE